MLMANLKNIHKKAVEKKQQAEAAVIERAAAFVAQAEAHRKAEKWEAAQEAYKQALQSDPRHISAYAGWAGMLAVRGSISTAHKVLEKLASFDEDAAYGAGIDIGVQLNERALYRHTIAFMPFVVNIKKTAPQAYTSLTSAMTAEGKFKEARAIAEAALVDCEFPSGKSLSKAILHQVIGNCYMNQDADFEKAAACFKKSLEAYDALPQVYLSFATAKKHQDTDDVRLFITKAEALLAVEKDNLKTVGIVAAAVSKIYDDLKAYDKAMHFSDMSNAAYAALRPYDPKVHEQFFENTVKCFDAAFFAKTQASSSAFSPIFLLGSPRAGSTLLQQMLGKHSKVAPGDEFMLISPVVNKLGGIEYTKAVPSLGDEEWDAFAAFYAQEIQKHKSAEGGEHIIDKQLYNYKVIGLICMMFPKAKIVHVRRHPLDVALSSYMNAFLVANEHTNKWEWMLHFYKLYDAYMAHWHAVSPIKIHDVYYPDVVGNTEETMKKAVEYLGLEWEEACASPESAGAMVKTASVWQARQKIYTGSIERWKRYEAYVEPHMEGFKPYIEAFENRTYVGAHG
jgi:tetratricopeptide (TPR) repeat protein